MVKISDFIVSIKNLFNTPLFPLKKLVKLTVLFFSTFLICNFIIRALFTHIVSAKYLPNLWPMSIACFRVSILGINSVKFPEFSLTLADMGIVLLYVIFFFLLLRYLHILKNPYFLYFTGLGSVLLSNLIHGVYNGLVFPIVGMYGIEYYYDAIKISDSLAFIRNYNAIQPTLLCHSKVHPPGAVLTYKFLNDIFASPQAISIALMCISLLIIFYIYKLIKEEFNKDLALFVSLFFIFIPAIQIYYLSSLDGVIAFTFLGALYHYLRWRKEKSWFDYTLCIVFLFLSAFLTYMAIFLILLIVLHSLKDKDIKRIVILFTPLVFIFLGFYFLLNFNYIAGFITASQIENPYGPFILVQPITYLVTRLENIAEIILFFGPVATLLLYRGLKNKTNEMTQLCKLAMLVLLIMFLTGAYKTGETARACLYIYPLLLLPIAYYLSKKNDFSIHEKRQILFVLWVQSILMQIFLFFSW